MSYLDVVGSSFFWAGVASLVFSFVMLRRGAVAKPAVPREATAASAGVDGDAWAHAAGYGAINVGKGIATQGYGALDPYAGPAENAMLAAQLALNGGAPVPWLPTGSSPSSQPAGWAPAAYTQPSTGCFGSSWH